MTPAADGGDSSRGHFYGDLIVVVVLAIAAVICAVIARRPWVSANRHHGAAMSDIDQASVSLNAPMRSHLHRRTVVHRGNYGERMAACLLARCLRFGCSSSGAPIGALELGLDLNVEANRTHVSCLWACHAVLQRGDGPCCGVRFPNARITRIPSGRPTKVPGLFDVLSQHHPGVRHKPLASVEVAVGY